MYLSKGRDRRRRQLEEAANPAAAIEREREYYVDKDRAAVMVVGGNNDIIRDLKFKERRDRFDKRNNPMALLDDSELYETYLAQGEHELRYAMRQ